MNAEDALLTAAGLLAVTGARLRDALPALRRVVADVESDWLDDAGRAWAERAGLVQRALDREVDAALAAGRLVVAALERLATPVDGAGAVDPAAGPGPVAGRPGEGPPPGEPGGGGTRADGADATASVGGGPAGSRPGGPRLAGTDARRVDDERGMSIARLSDDAGPG
ncbi:hypothetical protein GCM10017691_52850 [Pseudonocardia petroleophila]|uniref:Uncharacterized protein n=1 Tax=Pseudonocardia petroleophila TaxID=37331 RepID=A0A7G7MPA1_9PSEU|nr:hypothetical protein [Pseudonocardia petroleophila]QNG54612.1 hypothetical protein H6H00_12410 [Pseudonocardia petroleophila]